MIRINILLDIAISPRRLLSNSRIKEVSDQFIPTRKEIFMVWNPSQVIMLINSIDAVFYIAHSRELSEIYADRIDHGRHRGGINWPGHALILAITLPAAWLQNLTQKIWYVIPGKGALKKTVLVSTASFTRIRRPLVRREVQFEGFTWSSCWIYIYYIITVQPTTCSKP